MALFLAKARTSELKPLEGFIKKVGRDMLNDDTIKTGIVIKINNVENTFFIKRNRYLLIILI